MAQLFISYKTEDREWARKLATAFELRGHSVWWDRELKAGAYFRDAISRELKTCDVAIVIWTPRSVESPWVRDEADHASRRKKLLPVMVSKSESGADVELELPLGFGQIHAEDITRWDGRSEAEVIGKINANIEAIVADSDNWSKLMRVGEFARRDAVRFFSSISSEIGGLPISSLFIGSILLALLGTLAAGFGLMMGGDGFMFIPLLLFLPVTAGLVALARVLTQFIVITTGLSSRHFFDNSFSLVFMFSGLVSILLVSGVYYVEELTQVSHVLIFVPTLTLILMLIVGVARASFTGTKLLFARL